MTDLDPGDFRLRSAITPALPAGRYEVNITQTIGDAGTIDPVARQIEVVAPQFTLSATGVQSVYPPPNSTGSYDTRLAQIVLKRRTLPWERELTGNDPARRPWLALVLLTDAEGELRTGRPVTEAVPPLLHAELGVTAASGVCDYLETSADVVAKVFPRPGDLPLLCHVREVSLADTELAGSDEDGQLAVVLSARLPRAPTGEKLEYGAYLVSLEHRLAALPPDGGATAAVPGPVQLTPAAPRTQRFPVLARWRFTAAGSGDFESLMRGLDVGGMMTAPQGCPPVAPTGHTVIAHRTRRGEETTAWYRGPLVPREPVRRPPDRPVFAADQARAVATDGMEDLSEAAAFEVGRLLAMSDARFLGELLAWRRDTMAAAVQDSTLGLVPGVTGLGIDPATAGRTLALAMIDKLATGRGAALGTPIPLVALPPDFLDPKADILAIAAGFGLDPKDVEQILSGAAPDRPVPHPPPVAPLESSFDALVAHPDLLRHLRIELRREVRALAAGSGLDPDMAVFDPAAPQPSTVDDLYR